MSAHEQTNVKFAIKFDPKNPEEFFYEIDKLGIEIIAKSKFMTARRAIELLESIEISKQDLLAKIEKMNDEFPISLDGSKD